MLTTLELFLFDHRICGIQSCKAAFFSFDSAQSPILYSLTNDANHGKHLLHRSEDDTLESLDQFVNPCGNFGLTMNTKKTEIMHPRPPNTPYTEPNLLANNLG